MRYSLIAILFLVSCSLYSQIVTIIDVDKGSPLKLVTLSSEKPRVFALTNSKGQADISDFVDCEVIEIRIMGYKTKRLSYNDIKEMSFEVSLESAMISLDRFVVSATRWKQSSRDIPAKISTITASEVAKHNPQTAADLLLLSGEVFMQKSQQGGGSPMIRGFAANRLLYAVDGIRMNNAIFRSGNLQQVISLDPFTIENSEVFFGPGTVIYGSDAIGGVMTFQTITPQFGYDEGLNINGKAVTRFSSANNERTGHFNINLGWGKWAVVTSFTSNSYDHLRMGSYGPKEYLRHHYVRRFDSVDVVVTNNDPKIQNPTAYSQTNILQKIRFKPNKKWDFMYGFHYSETTDYDRYDRHLRYRDNMPQYGEWRYGPQKWMMNHLQIDHENGNSLFHQMTVRIAHQLFEESRISRSLNNDNREIRIENVEAISLNIDFNKPFESKGAELTKHQLFYGLEAIHNTVNSEGISENILSGVAKPGPSRYPQSTWTSLAAYITNQYRISPKLLLEAGGRYSYFSMDNRFDTMFYPFPYTDAILNNAALTGSIGFVYRPDNSWMINAGLSTGFRSPNVDDAGKIFDSAPGAVVVPNPDLNAEYVYNAEISVAKVFGDYLKIDFTSYYTHLNNAMVVRDFSLNGKDSIFYDGSLSRVMAVQNAAIAQIKGVQVGFELKWASGFSIISRYNVQKGIEVMDDGTVSPARHAAPSFGSTSINYNKNKISLSIYSLYSSSVNFEIMPVSEVDKTELYALDDNGNPYSPGWYELNFKVMYDISETFSISAGLENITDQRYRPYSSGLTAPGRNFIISLKGIF